MTSVLGLIETNSRVHVGFSASAQFLHTSLSILLTRTTHVLGDEAGEDGPFLIDSEGIDRPQLFPHRRPQVGLAVEVSPAPLASLAGTKCVLRARRRTSFPDVGGHGCRLIPLGTGAASPIISLRRFVGNGGLAKED